MGRRTCGAYQAKVHKEKSARQFSRTEANRKRKQAKHNKRHPNYIRGMEEARKRLAPQSS